MSIKKLEFEAVKKKFFYKPKNVKLLTHPVLTENRRPDNKDNKESNF